MSAEVGVAGRRMRGRSVEDPGSAIGHGPWLWQPGLAGCPPGQLGDETLRYVSG